MLSIIIPNYNDAESLQKNLPVLKRNFPHAEILVVDGGSSDGSQSLVEQMPAVSLIRSSRLQRAYQMNLGAYEATGSVLLFLHADTVLSVGACADVIAAAKDPQVKAGFFRFKLDEKKWKYRSIEWMVKKRIRLFNLPYGDQGLFIRKDFFDKLDGFPALDLMEDVAMIEKIKRNEKLFSFPGAALTSARRWKKKGVVRISLFHGVLLFAYKCGVKPETLSGWRKKWG